MTITITGQLQKLEAFERKFPLWLDYLGFIPGVGSGVGIVRLIVGIAMAIFYSIKAATTDMNQDKQTHRFWSAQAAAEAFRGIMEITWFFNLINVPLSCGYISSYEEETNLLSDELAGQRPLKLVTEGVIATETCIPHGRYIYIDNHDRSKATHYSSKNYNNKDAIWHGIVMPRHGDFGGYQGAEGYVLKEGYQAQPVPQTVATYQIQAIATK